MTTTNKHTNKFRPSLSQAEILYLIDLCHSDTREATAKLSVSILGKLKVLTYKISEGIARPAFSATERQSMEEKLFTSPADRRSAAHSKYLINPNLCTPEELEMVKLYRYENNLMTQEEETDYEESL